MAEEARRTWIPLAVRIGFGLGSIIAAFVFTLRPEIDLSFTGLFYSGDGNFPMKHDWWVVAVYEGIPILTAAVVLFLLVVLIVNRVRGRSSGPFTSRAAIYGLCVLAVGPGLVVNLGFKGHWGRARPREVTEFGGDRRFTPAFVISDQRDHNGSFVSGHASIAFAFLAIPLLVRRRRWAWWLAGISFGSIVGLARIVEGAHFLSDVVFSGVFTFLTAWVVHYALYRRASSRLIVA